MVTKKKTITKTTTKCTHPKLIPIEYGFAKVSYPNGYKEAPHYDYAISILHANIARVKRFYCFDCKTEVDAPRRKD